MDSHQLSLSLEVSWPVVEGENDDNGLDKYGLKRFKKSVSIIEVNLGQKFD